mgnify:CR=1 FL=1
MGKSSNFYFFTLVTGEMVKIVSQASPKKIELSWADLSHASTSSLLHCADVFEIHISVKEASSETDRE